MKRNKFHQLKLKKKAMNFAYQVRSYSDKEQSTQLSAAEYASMQGLVCINGEVDDLPNVCVLNAQIMPPILVFVDAITNDTYECEPLEFVGARPDPRR